MTIDKYLRNEAKFGYLGRGVATNENDIRD
jgi:hypothetical protein